MKIPDPDKVLQEALILEREAHKFLIENRNDEAFEAYRTAANLYRELGKFDQAGHCFTKAGSCWGKHVGIHPYRKAAEAFETAGGAFLSARNYEQAIFAFTDAAHLYEKEGYAAKFSACYYQVKKVWCEKDKNTLMHPSADWKDRFSAFFRILANLHSRMIWGYGEKPFRTLLFGVGMVLTCAFVYWLSGPAHTFSGSRNIHPAEALYLSMVTFTTVGYGDFMPGTLIARFFAAMEALSGIVFTPLFLIGLSRRYLRI